MITVMKVEMRSSSKTRDWSRLEQGETVGDIETTRKVGETDITAFNSCS